MTAQTGGWNLRIDTCSGVPDVTFYRSRLDDLAFAWRGRYAVAEIERELRAAGLIRPNKVYAVYYDGDNLTGCGSAASPGHVSALYLHGLPNAPVPCDTNPFAAGDTFGYLEMAFLHEVIHSLGFVAPCARHYDAGHISTPRDIMSTSPGWAPYAIDRERSEYWRHGIPGCRDLVNGAFLSPLPPAQELPIRW